MTGKQKRDLHIKTVHEGAKDFECPYCSKKFSTQSNLKVHEAAAHTGNYPHKCNLCQRGFNRKKLFEKHLEKCSVGEVSNSASEINKTQGIIIVPNPSPYHFGDITIMPE